jgi:H+-transporting ATPase
MSLTTDRASPAGTPSVWRIRRIIGAAGILGVCKLAFSSAVLALAKYRLALSPTELQTVAFITIVFGNQALLYALRERRNLWSSIPSGWVLASSGADITIVSVLALSGTLMMPVTWNLLLSVIAMAAGYALILDWVKLQVRSRLAVD